MMMKNEGMKANPERYKRAPILRRIVEVIVREIDSDRIVLFGSRARGNYTEGSDYGILVLEEDVGPEGRRTCSWSLPIGISTFAVLVLRLRIERFTLIRLT